LLRKYREERKGCQAKAGQQKRDGLPTFPDQGALNHQSSQNHKAENLFVMDCAQYGETRSGKWLSDSELVAVICSFRFYRFFIAIRNKMMVDRI